MIKWQGMLRGI